jgi:predicted ABC-type ATPase
MDARQPKLRVFAGPNGSGKSTVIDFIRNYKVNEKNVEFGYYINADDIASALKTKEGFSLKQYDFEAMVDEFNQIVSESGLLNKEFTFTQLIQTYRITDNSIHCIQESRIEQLAQIIADYLRKKLLKERKRFSFETVFSHSSKLDIMRDAVEAGYYQLVIYSTGSFSEYPPVRMPISSIHSCNEKTGPPLLPKEALDSTRVMCFRSALVVPEFGRQAMYPGFIVQMA